MVTGKTLWMGISGAGRMVRWPPRDMEERVGECPWTRVAHVLILIIPRHGQNHCQGHCGAPWTRPSISSPDGGWCESGVLVKEFGDLPPALRPHTPRL